MQDSVVCCGYISKHCACFQVLLKSTLYRAMLCIRGTSHGPLSVSVCLCLSQVGVVLKPLNVGSQKQQHTIAQGH